MNTPSKQLPENQDDRRADAVLAEFQRLYSSIYEPNSVLFEFKDTDREAIERDHPPRWFSLPGGRIVIPSMCVIPAGYLSRDALDSLPPVEWLVQDTLQARTASEIYGKYGVGKTILVLDLAACVAIGKPWHGRKVRRGKVVYVYAEGGEGLKSRLVAWEKKFNRGRKVPNDRILFLPVPMDLTSKDARSKLLAAIRLWSPSEDPTLIVFDTLFQVAGDANLNEGADMKRITDAVTDIRRQIPSAHVLLVHHDTKAGGSGGLGSVHLPGALWSLFEIEAKGHELRFICQKQRNKRKELAHATFEIEEILAGTIDEYGGQETAAVMRKTRDGIDKGGKTTATTDDKAILAALGSFGAKGASSNQWRKACRDTGIKVGNDSFGPMRDAFARAGDVLIIEGRYYLPQHAPT